MESIAFVSPTLQVGERLQVHMAGQALGLGTYVWDGTILLDTGKIVRQEKCQYTSAPPSKVPALRLYLPKPVKTFYRDGGLFRSPAALASHQFVIIEQIAVAGWNHGEYLAGKFYDRRSKEFWLLISDLDLPEEKAPHLRLVTQ
jgi:hypothetical protein